MGQQCCSNSNADNREHDPNAKELKIVQGHPFNNTNSNLQYSTGDEFQFLKNFAPVDTVPRPHYNVI
jgi:hypothetical protein